MVISSNSIPHIAPDNLASKEFARTIDFEKEPMKVAKWSIKAPFVLHLIHEIEGVDQLTLNNDLQFLSLVRLPRSKYKSTQVLCEKH